MPLPPALANMPELMPGLELYWNGYKDLHSCRVDGVIPWTVIDAYSTRLGLDAIQYEDMHRHIRAMEKERDEMAKKKQTKSLAAKNRAAKKSKRK